MLASSVSHFSSIDIFVRFCECRHDRPTISDHVYFSWFLVKSITPFDFVPKYIGLASQSLSLLFSIQLMCLSQPRQLWASRELSVTKMLEMFSQIFVFRTAFSSPCERRVVSESNFVSCEPQLNWCPAFFVRQLHHRCFIAIVAAVVPPTLISAVAFIWCICVPFSNLTAIIIIQMVVT